MANELFESIYGGGQKQAPPQEQQFQPPMNIQDLANRLSSNPALTIRQGGFSVPDEIVGNAQSVIMYLLKTGQIGPPALQWARRMASRSGF